MATVNPTDVNPRQGRPGVAWSSKRFGLLLAALAVVAIIATVAVAVVQRDPHPSVKCVPAQGATHGSKSTSGSCFANTKTTGVGVTKPGASPGADSP